MKWFLKELGHVQEEFGVQYDNQSVIYLSKNPSFYSKSKHTDIRYHWIRKVFDEKKLQLEKVHTDKDGANMMTKTLPKDKQGKYRQLAGMYIVS